MPEKKLFGTDGIRGVAGQYPLDPPTVYVAGRALGQCLRERPSFPGNSGGVLIGQDPRESSGWMAETLSAGLAEEGIPVHSAGVITTPGVAYLARACRFAVGVMISASHNPYYDNGIKVFTHSGYKLPDAQESQVEEIIFALSGGPGGRYPAWQAAQQEASPNRAVEAEASLSQRYLDFLCRLLPPGFSLGGLKMVLDCANGSASALAPELFQRLRARVTVINAKPDGRNINRDCGSLHTGQLQAYVPKAGADLGVAFDGDADRALFATSGGELVNGDGVLLLAARHMKAAGRFRNPVVVATIMSNLGLERALAGEGIRMVRTPVGDKYVLDEMLRRGANLGGEQSGHVIFSDDHTTGDGLLTTLRVAQVMVESGQTLADLVAGLEVFPQVIKNVRVRERVAWEALPEVQAAIRASQEYFGDAGRVIVRYSGTEALARIMVEGADARAVEEHASAIAAALEKALG